MNQEHQKTVTIALFVCTPPFRVDYAGYVDRRNGGVAAAVPGTAVPTTAPSSRRAVTEGSTEGGQRWWGGTHFGARQTARELVTIEPHR
jgi:hypothetical protein